MKCFISIFVFSSLITLALGQCDGDNNFLKIGRSPAELAPLLALQNCTSLKNLVIETTYQFLKNLTIFKKLEQIEGAFSISEGIYLDTIDFPLLKRVGSLNVAYNSKLANLNLGSLSEINGDMIVSSQDSMTSINVPKLTKINGKLQIDNNHPLSSISGFEKLTTVLSIEISSNSELVDIKGFANLTTVAGDLVIFDNGKLTDISGFLKLTSVSGGIHYSANGGTTLNGFTNIAGRINYLTLEDNANLINLDNLCKINAVTSILSVQRNPRLANLNGLYSITEADNVNIIDNIGLESIDGLSSLDQASNINIYGSRVKCGYLLEHITDNSNNRIECCGDSVKQDNEECEQQDSICSKTCFACSAATTSNCNCNKVNPCSAAPFGICLTNGTCIYDQNLVQKSMCGLPIPGYTSYTTASSTSSTTASQTTVTSSTTTNTEDRVCTIEGKILACNLVVSDLDLRSATDITVLSNLTISGATIKFNASTKVHVLGCLILKNNSKLSLTKSIFQNHRTVKVFDYKCVEGTFVDYIYSDVETAQKDCYKEDKVTYDKESLSITFKNPCEDSKQVTSSIVALCVIIGVVSIVGAGVYYFVRNRKRQIKKAQGLGAKN